MPKEWILNQANMRWQLNRPRHVGHVAEEIRKCAPKSVEDWGRYYFNNVRTKEQLEEVGKAIRQSNRSMQSRNRGINRGGLHQFCHRTGN